MKYELPKNHGLTKELLNSPFIYQSEGKPCLTDAQFAALEKGVAKGSSLLLVAPTSSGKTEVGLIGAASWLAKEPMTNRVVYLVSHRALARQKFNMLNGPMYRTALGVDSADLIVSNGEITLDGTGVTPDDPLGARFLIATYEKFLALLASSGLREDMSHYCIVADEFQLIADRSRGQDLEILFTIVRQAKYGQFVGLSAVLDARDLDVLAQWMGAAQVRVGTREVPLEYELRTTRSKYVWRTDGPDEPQVTASDAPTNVVEILTELEANSKDNFPVAVFCMTKAEVERLARAWGAVRGADGAARKLEADLFSEQTALSAALGVYMPHGFGLHTADLIDGEKELVEKALDADELAVVFATTTLAQGLNYSFRTVIFAQWARWNSARRQREPIVKSEFHNIAGRAGRLGKVGGQAGRVIFCAADVPEQRAALRYLSSEMESVVVGQIDPRRIDQVALQLLSSGLVKSRDELLAFLCDSLSGFIAQNEGVNQDEVWAEKLDQAVHDLLGWGFVRS